MCAAVESIAYQVHERGQCFREDAGGELSLLQVDGGASRNDFLMQFQAAILGVPFSRPECLEVTAFGAAAMAGLGVGLWSDAAELASVTAEAARFSPRLSEESRGSLLSGWGQAVKRASY